jgi:predicted glutamine amidotransferase
MSCWTFQHNGEISGFEKIKRSLQFAIAEDLFPRIQGTTDSETAFFLALTFGLADRPRDAMEKMVGFVEHHQRQAGIAEPFRLTCAFSDGSSAVRDPLLDRQQTQDPVLQSQPRGSGRGHQ